MFLVKYCIVVYLAINNSFHLPYAEKSDFNLEQQTSSKEVVDDENVQRGGGRRD
jgi:hypothetical protein